MLSFDEARERTLSDVEPLGAERVDLSSAADRVLAETLVARDPIPAQDYSAMDGYAVQSADFSGSGPWPFEVQGVSRTGHAPPPRLVPGTSCRIFTGAALPAGADAVHLQEDAEVLPDGSVRFALAVRAGENVRRRGRSTGRRVPPIVRPSLRDEDAMEREDGS